MLNFQKVKYVITIIPEELINDNEIFCDPDKYSCSLDPHYGYIVKG